MTSPNLSRTFNHRNRSLPEHSPASDGRLAGPASVPCSAELSPADTPPNRLLEKKAS